MDIEVTNILPYRIILNTQGIWRYLLYSLTCLHTLLMYIARLIGDTLHISPLLLSRPSFQQRY